MAAGAPKDNKNAEKWSEEKAKKLFETVLDKTKEKEDYIISGKVIKAFSCHFIGEAADEADSNLDQLDYLKGKYPKLEPLYKSIKRKCERNCFTDSKKGVIIPSIAIVNLKSNHGWTDRVESKETTTVKYEEPVRIVFVKKK